MGGPWWSQRSSGHRVETALCPGLTCPREPEADKERAESRVGVDGLIPGVSWRTSEWMASPVGGGGGNTLPWFVVLHSPALPTDSPCLSRKGTIKFSLINLITSVSVELALLPGGVVMKQVLGGWASQAECWGMWGLLDDRVQVRTGWPLCTHLEPHVSSECPQDSPSAWLGGESSGPATTGMGAALPGLPTPGLRPLSCCRRGSPCMLVCAQLPTSQGEQAVLPGLPRGSHKR